MSLASLLYFYAFTKIIPEQDWMGVRVLSRIFPSSKLEDSTFRTHQIDEYLLMKPWFIKSRFQTWKIIMKSLSGSISVQYSMWILSLFVARDEVSPAVWQLPTNHLSLSQALLGIQASLSESTRVSLSSAVQYCEIHCFPQFWVKSAQALWEAGGKAIADIPVVILGRVAQSCFSAPSLNGSQLYCPHPDAV